MISKDLLTFINETHLKYQVKPKGKCGIFKCPVCELVRSGNSHQIKIQDRQYLGDTHTHAGINVRMTHKFALFIQRTVD